MPPPTTTATSTPLETAAAMSRATEARTEGSTPVPASPARASPESLRRTRLEFFVVVLFWRCCFLVAVEKEKKKNSKQPSPSLDETNAHVSKSNLSLLSFSLPVSRLAVPGRDLVVLSRSDDGARRDERTQREAARGGRRRALKRRRRSGGGAEAGQRRGQWRPRRQPAALGTLRARSDSGAMCYRGSHGGFGAIEGEEEGGRACALLPLLLLSLLIQ